MVHHTGKMSYKSISLLLAAAAAHAQDTSLYIPYYGTTANGFTAPPRGWNSFGLQALEGGFKPTQDSILAQCQNLNVSAGYTLCSIDSGWSSNGGDPYGRLVPDTSVFPNLTALADELHSNGRQLGVYILPGALSSDANVIVEGTDIQLGSLFDTSQPSYNLRQTFDFSKDGVQQWHDSVIKNFAAMYILPTITCINCVKLTNSTGESIISNSTS